jgi:hypothetical protein
MFTHPEIQHQSVDPCPNRSGKAGLSTADFSPVARLDANPEGWIPYCADEHADQLICATGVDPHVIASRGLHYAQLRTVTRAIATLPAHLVPTADSLPIERVYVFCPGRCGSTLLCQILRAAGLPAFAEPGFYLPFLRRARGQSTPVRQQMSQTIAQLEYLLLKPFDTAPVAVIKPHPYCSGDLDLFLGALPSGPRPRTIALLRQIRPWSQSWSRFNQTDVTQDVEIYRYYITQLERLMDTTDCLLISYEELVAAPTQVVERIGRHVGVAVDTDAIGESLAMDAHTTDRVWTTSESPTDTLRDTMLHTLWQFRRPDELIARLGIGAQTG